jgi:hypothetical protein
LLFQKKKKKIFFPFEYGNFIFAPDFVTVI